MEEKKEKTVDFNNISSELLHPENSWICPKCGSKHVHCHPGMFVDRFECLDCHWEWR